MSYKAEISGIGEPALVTDKSPLIIQTQTNAVESSPLFRDPTIAEGGAIPGLQAFPMLWTNIPSPCRLSLLLLDGYLRI